MKVGSILQFHNQKNRIKKGTLRTSIGTIVFFFNLIFWLCNFFIDPTILWGKFLNSQFGG